MQKLVKAWLKRSKRIRGVLFQFGKELFFEFNERGCQRSAAALTYMTLFALVPLMTVTYTMFSAIPAFDGVGDQLNGLIFHHFLPETGEEVSQYLSDFSSQARRLSGVGVVMLLVTAYLMLRNIETTFNSIWGVKQARSGLSGYLLYWAILSVGPILVAAAFLLSTYLLSVQIMLEDLDGLGVMQLVYRVVPWALTSAAFTLLFVAVPNCRVPLKFGAIGGVVTAFAFEVVKAIFGYIVANSSFKLIYGAFAVVPLFLLWVNLLWTIILGGAVFVRTLAEHSYASRISRLSDMIVVLICLALFREKAALGESVSDRDCVRLGIGLVHWQRMRSLMVEHRWIAVTESGDYVLSRDLRRANIWEVASMVRMPVSEELSSLRENIAGRAPWFADFLERQSELRSHAESAFSVSLESLFAAEREEEKPLTDQT
ncbi:YihY family inner membrane protein [Teredinibacter turnerae]|uniref:YihY family inner membrane protein n=1 Tax=Teredinibacter turnerae TaxID=2426 RepID=UPI0003A5DB71|nr:YihY family inner membrane protein [Teredinibacter turnerae]